MTMIIETRMVEARVQVATCNRCGKEAFDKTLIGWMVCCLYEKRADPIMQRETLGTDGAKDQHVCPDCQTILNAAMNAPTAIRTAAEMADHTARLLVGDVRYVDATLDTDGKVAALVARDRAQMSAIIHAIGGTVEGDPTTPVNYLQRLRQLVDVEAEHRGCKALIAAREG